MKSLSRVTVFISLYLLVFGPDHASSEGTLYDGYQLFDVIPETESQLHALKSVKNHLESEERHAKDHQGIQLWHESHIVNRPTALLIPSDLSESFFSYLKDHNLKYEVKHSDFGKHLAEEKQKEEKSRELSRKSGTFNLNMYHSYDEIMGYLNETAKVHENFVQFGSLGKSFEGRELPYVKIGFPTKSPKKIMLLDAGFHANEWNGHVTALHFIDRLVSDSALIDLLHDIDVYVVPVMNPDGYEYSRTKEGYGWRRTRSGPYGDQKCYGVDLNRNWDYHWCTDASSHTPCHQYCGEMVFSEPESRALQQFMLKNKVSLKGYVTLHSQAEIIIHPYGCCEGNVTAQYPDDAEDLRRVANKAADAIVEAGGPRYAAGTAQETINYTASGASDDYAKSMGIKFVFTIEIGREKAVPQEQIESTARQVVAALIVFAREVQVYEG